MATADQALLEALERKHPEYDTWAPEWELYSDVLGDRAPFDKEKYLPRGEHEDDALYELRVDLAEFIPDSTLAIDKLIGAMFQQRPKRDLKPSMLADFTDNVDLLGQSMDELAKQLMEQLLGYGTIRCLINVRYPEGVAAPLTRADEQQLGVRPFKVLYNPLDVIDWEYDRWGELLSARIVEEDSVPRPGAERAKVKRFYQYDREVCHWWVFEQSQENWVKIDEGETVHGLGMVPMVIASLKPITPMVGKSYIRYSSRADIQKFQSESDLAYDTYIHSHPTLKIWTTRDLAKVGVGSNAFVKLNPNEPREDVGYLEAPASAFQNLMEAIREKRTAVYRQARTDPLGVLESGSSTFQASGVSRAWSFATSEARILIDLAGKMEDIENRIYEIVLRYSTRERVPTDEHLFEGAVQYPEEFDLGSVRDLLDEAVIIKQEINSPLLVKALHKRIAAAKVGNSSVKDMQEIFEEIDANELLGVGTTTATNPAEMPLAWEEPQEAESEPDEETREENAEKAAAGGGATESSAGTSAAAERRER